MNRNISRLHIPQGQKSTCSESQRSEPARSENRENHAPNAKVCSTRDPAPKLIAQRAHQRHPATDPVRRRQVGRHSQEHHKI
eukprot:2960143-Prymnesium_polylepis.1